MPVRYRFDLRADELTDIDIVLEGDTARIEPATEFGTNVTLSCDTESFVFLMYGRLGFGYRKRRNYWLRAIKVWHPGSVTASRESELELRPQRVPIGGLLVRVGDS